MPWGLHRDSRRDNCISSHSVAITCSFAGIFKNKTLFVDSLERVRRWYVFYVVGYVVMPEHIHLLISEPERSSLKVALQMLKQIVSRKARRAVADDPFWQPRYYDFNVWSERKRVEKLRYIHNNPVKRG